ncbi:unnamed protein product [Gongylonema pulchrum]|uniref:Uncharacterized protein n=1 Tax=Gongylonema pulchrum TaxID=637853 RepID=A0A3P7N9R9_9BILA|nr:unnamed protein product [Gongylonema pulchrum]
MGYNPFTLGCWGNIRHTLFSNQFPAIEAVVVDTTEQQNQREISGRTKRGSDHTVIYIPDASSVSDGHIRMRQMVDEEQLIGTTLSLTQSTHRNAMREGSTCNLLEDQDNESASRHSVLYHAAVEESIRFAHANSSQRTTVVQGPLVAAATETTPETLAGTTGSEMVRSNSASAALSSNPTAAAANGGFLFVENEAAVHTICHCLFLYGGMECECSAVQDNHV